MMTREQAKQKMTSSNNSQDVHRLHGLSVIAEIYSDFKLELEAEYKRGQDSILSRSCESCKHKMKTTIPARHSKSMVIVQNCNNSTNFTFMNEITIIDGCNSWEQK